MLAKGPELQLSLLKLKNVTAQRMFRKPYISLKGKQQALVDASLADLLTSMASMVTELFESHRQVGFGTALRKSLGSETRNP